MNADRITSEDMRASVKFSVPMSKSTVAMVADQQDELLDVIAKVADMDLDSDVASELQEVLRAFGRQS
jgi:uncharacterized protein Yka (UPF0111/DUF47 family)